MITKHRRVVWAEELGIDMDELRKEHPDYWEQIMMKKRIGQKAEAYWARERFLARMEYSSQAIIQDTQPEPVKAKPKRAKVGRYEFTDRQLEIAKAVLDAHNTL